MNPTQATVEERIAALEGGVDALLVSSGQAAETLAILNPLRSVTTSSPRLPAAPTTCSTTRCRNWASRCRSSGGESWRRRVAAGVAIAQHGVLRGSISQSKNDILDIEAIAGWPTVRGTADRGQHSGHAVPDPGEWAPTSSSTRRRSTSAGTALRLPA